MDMKELKRHAETAKANRLVDKRMDNVDPHAILELIAATEARIKGDAERAADDEDALNADRLNWLYQTSIAGQVNPTESKRQWIDGIDYEMSRIKGRQTGSA